MFIPLRYQKSAIVALAVSGVIIFLPTLLGNGRWGSNYVVAVAILSPGICICRWFMPTQFATQNVRLAIVSVVSALFYWPVVWLVIASIFDRKRIVRTMATNTVVFAVIVGFLLSLTIWTLNQLAPRIFGLLNTPGELLQVLVYVTGLQRKFSATVQIFGNTVGYSVICYLVWYWRFWRIRHGSEDVS